MYFASTDPVTKLLGVQVMHWILHRFFIIALILSPFATVAATPEQLIELRDAVVPDTCAPAGDPGLGPITQVQLGAEGRLYLVPCRTTFADVLSVAILERTDRLRALVFPDPGVDFADTWEHARMNRIGVTYLLSSPGTTPTEELVSTSRIAPGLGSGNILRLYAFDDGSPVLKRLAIQLDGRKPINLWDAP